MESGFLQSWQTEKAPDTRLPIEQLKAHKPKSKKPLPVKVLMWSKPISTNIGTLYWNGDADLHTYKLTNGENLYFTRIGVPTNPMENPFTEFTRGNGEKIKTASRKALAVIMDNMHDRVSEALGSLA